MSSTRQLIRSRCSEARNSSAEPNVRTLKPAAPSSRRTRLRIEASSSTMPMTGVIAVSFRRSSTRGDSPDESVCPAGIERYGALVVWGRPLPPSSPPPLHLDGLLPAPELVGDLLVQHPRHHEQQHLALPRREEPDAPLQLRSL